MKFGFDLSGNPIISGAKELLEKSNIITPTSKVVEIITRRIPSFELLEFEKEVNVNIFYKMFNLKKKFLNYYNNIVYIQTIDDPLF
jgi:hypothetical protein